MCKSVQQKLGHTKPFVEQARKGQKQLLAVKFIYSEKATKFCETSKVDLTITTEDKSMSEI